MKMLDSVAHNPIASTSDRCGAPVRSLPPVIDTGPIALTTAHNLLDMR
ncbi:hypothetical protein [Deinococcus sedimenti]|nr:hypothetical protein [Deinococcus sedimenti]